MVKALDLSSNGQMSAWVRTPLLVDSFSLNLNVFHEEKGTVNTTMSQRNSALPVASANSNAQNLVLPA